MQVGKLSVDVSDFSASVLIPSPVLDAIWNKASELLRDDGSLCMVPGGNRKDRIVKSTSSSRPHFVTAKKAGQYVCDGECPNWKSLKICSHSVAAAEHNGDLGAFIQWLKKVKTAPSITKLVTTTMPKGRGRKGCAPPRKKMKKVPVATRKSFADVLKEQTSAATVEHDQHVESSSSDSDDSERYDLTSSGGKFDIEYSLYGCGGDSQSSIPMSSAGRHHHSQQGGRVELTHSEAGTSTRLTVTGGTQESSFLPALPPPLVHFPSVSPQIDSPFELAFISGNISVCRGCRQKYHKPPRPPTDLCVRHKEWQKFVDPCGDQQSRYGDVYYHCNVACVQSRCPEFTPEMLQIASTMAIQLLPVHTEYILKQMPGKL